VASWEYDGDIPTEKLRTALTSILPQAIYIKSLEEVSDGFHARRDASTKLYRYTILKGRSPLRSQMVWELDYRLDIEKMRQAAGMLEGEHDYAALCMVDDPRTTIRVDSVTVEEYGQEIIIDVRGPAFLYKMVRRMVGIIAECGRGKLEPGDMGRLFGKDNRIQTVTAPARGLVLVEVKYEKKEH
jgi:tRNA pseudouridine38-40 synthase